MERRDLSGELRAALPDAPDRPLRLLGVWAHPDDEAYLSAGLMGRVTDAGGEVTLLTATLGELGFPDSDRREAAERSAQREAELRAAMRLVGVEDVRFMRWPDGGVDTIPERLATRRIASVICEVEPDVIVTFGPDGVTGHPDHVAVSRATTAAWKATGMGRLLYAASTVEWLDEFRTLHEELGVWMTAEPPGTPVSDLVVDLELDDAELDRKRAVLSAHASQTNGIAAAMGEATYRRWIAPESFRAPTAADLAAVPASARAEDEYLWSAAWVALTRDAALAA